MVSYEGLRDISPFILAVVTVVSAIFAFRQAERQKIRDATSPKVVTDAVGMSVRQHFEPSLGEAITNLTSAVSLNSAILTKIHSRLEKQDSRQEKEHELRAIIEAIKKGGIDPSP